MDSNTPPRPAEQKSPSASRAAVVRVFGEVPFHTDGAAVALAFGPDGSLWSIEEPGVLCHWNAANGSRLAIHTLGGPENVWLFSPDAGTLASASDDLSLWDVATGRQRAVLAQPAWVTAVAFQSGTPHVATGHEDGVVRLWDVAGLRLLRELTGHHGPVSALAFSADGSRLASAAEDRVIRVWQVDSGQLLGALEGHTDRIPTLAWHPHGHRLISAGWDTTARVWDTNTFQPIILLNAHAGQVTTLALSRDGGVLACADATNAIHVWDLTTHRSLAVLRGHAGEVRCLAFTPDGRQLASGGEDPILYLRSWQADSPAAKSATGTAAVAPREVRLALSPDSSRLAATDSERSVRIWDTASGQRLAPPGAAGTLLAVAYSPDGRWLAGGGADARLWLWEGSHDRPSLVLEGPKHPVTALAFSADSSLLASAGAADSSVWLWNVQTGQPLFLIPDAADRCAIQTLAFDPSGRLVAVGGTDWKAASGSDGALGVWDVGDRREVVTFGMGTNSVAFHRSGKRLASASLVHTVCLWDLEARRLTAELKGHQDSVTCVAYSADGRLLASGSDDHTVRLWNADTGACEAVATLDTQIKALCFSPDGRFLYTGNANASCYQLDVQRLLK